MGRAGRYTLSVMAWVAAYAGWSSILGLVVAAVTGDRPREVSTGVSALFTVIGPLVPTLVALWFNDWARDDFPTREQRRARSAPAATPRPAQDATDAADRPPAAAPGPPTGSAAAPELLTGAAVAPGSLTASATALADPAAPSPAMPPAAPPTVAAHPLGVPGSPAGNAPAGAFPVAPLLRDRD